MKTKMFYKQMGRSVKTGLTNVVILLVVTAFFVMSLNLYASSVHNLKSAAETYSTIAVMELYGDVNDRGQLTAPGQEDYQGYLSVQVDDYDLEPILNAPGVIGHDLRARCAAYIEGHPSRYQLNEENWKVTSGTLTFMEPVLISDEHVIRFKLAGDSTVTMPMPWHEDFDMYYNVNGGARSLDLEILEHSGSNILYESVQRFEIHGFFDISGMIIMGGRDPSVLEEHYGPYREQYGDAIRQLNRSDETDKITLYPGVEYVVNNAPFVNRFQEDEEQPTMLTKRMPFQFFPDFSQYFNRDFYLDYKPTYSGLGESVGFTYGPDLPEGQDAPFPLARWEDVQADPVLKEQWEGCMEASEYNFCTHSVTLTDDMSSLLAFHLDGMFLADGRMITQEEYDTGAKVCMVSKKKAQMHHWQLGDKLNMSFYDFEAYPSNGDDSPNTRQPVYHQGTEGFFDSGEYEIVGIFDQRPTMGDATVSQSAMSMPWEMIYIPHNAVQYITPREELPVHGSLLSIRLKNGAIPQFEAEMEALGLTGQKDGQFTPSFTFYDQGYSVIQPSLQHMYGTARLLLVLSTVLLVITCLLQAWFFAQYHKHTVGIYRMLGGKKHHAVAALLVCALAVTLLGALPGGMLGYALSEQVGQTILAGDLLQSEKYAPLRAFVLEGAARDAVSVRADAALSTLASCATMLFPLIFLVFVLGYIGKEPRELMPKSRT